MKLNFLYLFFATALLLVSACIDPITVGSDLLEEDRATLGQITDLTFTTKVVEDDSLLAFDFVDNLTLGTITFGQLTDDVFGQWKHGIYIIPTLRRNSADGQIARPAFADDPTVMVDSVVLILPLDTIVGLYGTNNTFEYRLKGLGGTMVDQLRNYYSNDRLTVDFNDLNRDNSFTAIPEATLVYDTLIGGGDSLPHVRIAFDDQFLTDLNQRPPSTFDSDTTFWQFLSGMFLEPTAESGSLLPIKFQRTGEVSRAEMYFFYPDTSDQSPTFYRAPLSLWLPSYQKNYTGSVAGDKLRAGIDNEQTLIAGQAGLLTEINFPNLTALENTVINQAELTFYLDEVEGYDYDTYPTSTFIALYYLNNDGNLVAIQDRQRLGNPNSSTAVRQFLGGDPQTDEDGNIFFQPRISVHMQQMVDGVVPSTIYLRVVPIDRDPSRLILRGPAASVRPATVKVTYTNLD